MNALRSNQPEDQPLPHPALPSVSVIMPIRNEEPFIIQVLEAVFRQNYPEALLEILVADGMSTDRTRELVRSMQSRHSNLRLIDNPEGIVPTAFNRALRAATGEVIVRLDGHCEYPLDYIYRVVTLRERLKADNLGGVLEPVGDLPIQRAICEAYRSPIGLGGAALRAHENSDFTQEVDAVHGGCWLKERLLAVNGMDERMVRNQDDELSFRLRKGGGRILQSTGIRVKYHVRSSFKQLFQQFAQYGYWKVCVIQKHPQQSSLRHYVPGAFVGLSVLCILLALFMHLAGVALLLLWVAYLGAVCLATAFQLRKQKWKLFPRTAHALCTMHVGYGCGFILGWIRSWTGTLPTDRYFERVTR